MKLYRNKKSGVIAMITMEDGDLLTLADQASDMQYDVTRAQLKKEWSKVKAAKSDGETNVGESPTVVTEDFQDEKVAVAREKLESLFDKVNDAFFGGRLPRLSNIVIGLGPLPFKQYDFVAEENAIMIGGQLLNGTLREVAVLMFHLAVHDNCAINNISATCQNGRYHNRVFKTMAEAAGFTVEMNRSVGYGLLTPGADFADKLGCTGEELDVPFIETPFQVVKTAKAPAARKAKPPVVWHECPVCGQKVRFREGMNIVCGDCQTAYTLVG